MLLSILQLLLFAGLFAALYPFVRNLLREEPLNKKHRDALAGEHFAALPSGTTHYAWLGPEDGPVVVLIHGFCTPMFIWNRNVEALAQGGFRVLRYDLYGRGYSDRPWTRYTMALFARQLRELLEAERVTGPVSLVGLSMGGAIALDYAAEHPERVSKIVLVAPVCFNDPPSAARLLAFPGCADWIMAAFGKRFFLKTIPGMLGTDREAARAFEAAYKEQFRFRGCVRALVSTLRHGPVMRQEALYERAASRVKCPGLLLWGTADEVILFSLHERVLEKLPHFEFHAIPEGNHCMNYQRAEEVNAFLLPFLR